MERVLLSTYTMKVIYDRREVNFDDFNTRDDFFEVLKGFLQDLLVNVRKQEKRTLSKTYNVSLTLDRPFKWDERRRLIYGYLKAGIDGDAFSVSEYDTPETDEYKVTSDKMVQRKLFFAFFLPSMNQMGGLVIQKKTKFGVKIDFTSYLQNYVTTEFPQNTLIIKSILNDAVYEKMMREGSLLKINAVKKGMPSSPDDTFHENSTFNNKGNVILTWKGHKESPLGSTFKTYIKKLVRNRKTNPNVLLEVDHLDIQFDNIEFELELNGKRKTFYVKDRSPLPDLDVTNAVNFDAAGDPTEDSMLEQALILFNENIANVPD